MGVKVIEGRWEDVTRQVKLNGRTVRVVYSDVPGTVVTFAETTRSAAVPPAANRESWLKKPIAFSGSHQPPKHPIDLDRDRIFEELHSDPR